MEELINETLDLEVDLSLLLSTQEVPNQELETEIVVGEDKNHQKKAVFKAEEDHQLTHHPEKVVQEEEETLHEIDHQKDVIPEVQEK